MIYNVVITSNMDGNIETSVKTFKHHKNAVEYLFSQYIDIKVNKSADIKQYDMDMVEKEMFHLWEGNYNYEVMGAVCGCVFEDEEEK